MVLQESCFPCDVNLKVIIKLDGCNDTNRYFYESKHNINYHRRLFSKIEISVSNSKSVGEGGKNWKRYLTQVSPETFAKFLNFYGQDFKLFAYKILSCTKKNRFFLFYSRCYKSGADLGFSRGGLIFKKISKILTTFFLGRPNRFFELSQSTILPLFWQNFLCRRQILKKNSQKSRFWALFAKILTKKSRFFGAGSPSKLVYIGAEGAFRKILGSVCQKWISEKVSKGGRPEYSGCLLRFMEQ